MKSPLKRFTASLAAALFLTGLAPSASAFDSAALTDQPVLNDLVRRIPLHSVRRERTLAALSSIQEMVILHERKMKGEGLPAVQRALFSANYSNILSALVNDQITEEYGRDLLALHRHLLEHAYTWAAKKNPNAEVGATLVVKLKNIAADLQENAEPVSVIPDTVRTPVINGHQIWVEELLVWGCHSRELSRGDLGHIGVLAARLERFERAYKRNGLLHESERRRLHERLIDLQRELISVLERNYYRGYLGR